MAVYTAVIVTVKQRVTTMVCGLTRHQLPVHYTNRPKPQRTSDGCTRQFTLHVTASERRTIEYMTCINETDLLIVQSHNRIGSHKLKVRGFFKKKSAQ